MSNPVENLRATLTHFSISNSELAKALAVDPSLVSRWLGGQRRLKAASPVMDALAEFILLRGRRTADIEWLKAQFERDGLPTDLLSVYRVKQNLIMWLASDGEALRKSLGSSPDAAAWMKSPRPVFPSRPAESGSLNIALALEPFLAEDSGAGVDIFLSSDETATAVDKEFSRRLIQAIEKEGASARLVVCVSGNTRTLSRLIGAYMQPLVSGHLQLSVVYGMTQAVTRQMQVIVPGKCAMLVTETTGSSLPIATIVDEGAFVREIQASFEQTMHYAKSVLHVYGDDFFRNILEILYMEYATPGRLDVVKDSINPMFMTTEAYERALFALGNEGTELQWRSAEFARFKAGMDEILRSGTVFREILSLSRLNQMARDGACRMPGLYFMSTGFINLYAGGCAEILRGYISYIEHVPNFHLLILDDLAALHAGNCWHIKENASVAVNSWSGDEPLMIHTDQIMLVGEFQAYFNALWAKGEGCIGNRSSVTAILQDVLKRLEERHVNGIRKTEKETPL